MQGARKCGIEDQGDYAKAEWSGIIGDPITIEVRLCECSRNQQRGSPYQ